MLAAAGSDDQLRRDQHVRLFRYDRAPIGETLRALHRRATSAWSQLLATPARRILVVSHFGVLVTLVQALLGLREDEDHFSIISYPHAAISEIWLRDRDPDPSLPGRITAAMRIALAKGAPAEGYPWHWSVYRWLDGENPTIDHHGDSRRLAVDLASFIAALQRIDSMGGPPASRGEPLATRDEPTRAAIEALRGELDTDAVTAAWEAALQVPPWTGRLVWVHADLAPGNVLLVRQRLGAVIDCSLSGLGDPACDLPIAWNLLPQGVRDLFRGTLQVDDATWARGRGWALSIALIQLPYYRDTNPALASSARHVIREILTDQRRTR